MMRWPAFWLLLLAALGITPAWALESAPVRSDRAVVTLVTDTDHVAAGTPFRAGLRLRMAPGWHTYWLNPGDAGTTPELHWTLPPGVTAGPIDWPAPQILREGPVTTYSYEHEITLPVTVTVGREAALPLHLAAHAEWLVCANICVPEQGDFTLDLPAGTPAPSAQAPLFAASDRLTPRPAPFTARIAPDGVLSVTGPGLSAAAVADAWFLPSAWGPVDQSAPEHFAAGPAGISIALKPGRAFKPAAALDGVLWVRDRGGQASYYTIAAAPGAVQPGTRGGVPGGAAAPVSGAAAGPGLARLLGFALLGGLILNLMPCVFPILAMKALSLTRSAGQGRRAAREGALAYLAGVLVAFAALGAVLLGARAAGSAAGWGFQFQSPAFVAAMAFVLFAVGLNLSGVFEVGGGRLAGSGQALTAREGLGGSFFTGLLAVVVATPCTAPFMGAAVAAALAAPVAVALAIFLALGLGLAAPYVVLAFWPGLARRLPRPGAWMDVLKQALAFPMYAATAWLVWVVSQQTGPAGLPFVLGGLVLVGAAAWAIGLAGRAGRAGRRAALAVALAAAIAAVLSLPGLSGGGEAGAQPLASADGGGAAAIEPYSDARLAALRAEGRPVFVNMTAAWCVSCLVNERVALGTASVRDAFARRGIAYLKGDWTRQDPAVTAFLRAHGRDGVPLYVFYPSGHAPAVVLPQILTPGTVLAAIGGAA